MTVSRAALVLLAAAIGLGALVGAGFLPSDSSGGASGAADTWVAAGASLPMLEGADVITGNAVTLARFKDKPLVVNVWASWCVECAAEAAALRRFADEHRAGVGLLGIDVEDSRIDARRFYREVGWQHPSIFDPMERLAARLTSGSCRRRSSSTASTAWSAASRAPRRSPSSSARSVRRRVLPSI